MIKKIFLTAIICAIPGIANALEYDTTNWRLTLDADGMIGTIQPKNDQILFIDDWDVKATATYKIDAHKRIGAVYSIDADCVDDDEYVHDAFILFENKNYGRAELGLTHSIARKMGLGLPDVGYLRINNKSILYKKLDLNRVLISDTTAVSGHESLRLNLATAANEHGQYGLSIAAFGDDYDYAIDGAFKIRRPVGKLKSAYSIAVSYMGKPHGYSENSYSAPVYADWRAQLALGMNLQYNSIVWSTSLRAIYDETPTNKTSDGLVIGTGASYDLLQYQISLTYLFSDTNVWHHHDAITHETMAGDYVHTVLASFRYKYTEHTSMFMSGGISDATPFFAVGIKSGF